MPGFRQRNPSDAGCQEAPFVPHGTRLSTPRRENGNTAASCRQLNHCDEPAKSAHAAPPSHSQNPGGAQLGAHHEPRPLASLRHTSAPSLVIAAAARDGTRVGGASRRDETFGEGDFGGGDRGAGKSRSDTGPM